MQEGTALISGGGLASGQDADRVAVVAQSLDAEYGLDLPSGGGARDVDNPIDGLGDRAARRAG